MVVRRDRFVLSGRSVPPHCPFGRLPEVRTALSNGRLVNFCSTITRDQVARMLRRGEIERRGRKIPQPDRELARKTPSTRRRAPPQVRVLIKEARQ